MTVVEVTVEDITNGNVANDSCPIAQAIKRILPDSDPWVNAARIWFGDGSIALLPHEASEFVRKFDEGEEVDPFDFELEIPSSVAPIAFDLDLPDETTP